MCVVVVGVADPKRVVYSWQPNAIHLMILKISEFGCSSIYIPKWHNEVVFLYDCWPDSLHDSVALGEVTIVRC